MTYWCDDRAFDMEQRRLDADQARAKRRMEPMTKLYRATNPQQIIDVFEKQAAEADRAAKRATTLRDARLQESEAITWRAAADILRNTDFAGWGLAAAINQTAGGTMPIVEHDPIGPGKVMHAPPGTVPHPTAHLTDKQREALALSEQKSAERIKREMLDKIDRLGRKGENVR